MHAIGIDVGSTNVKVVLVDDTGGIVADASRPLSTVTSGDAVTQDPDVLWASVRDAVRQVTAAAPEAALDVATVGVCSQYSSLVPVDADGRAVAPIKMYLDSRGSDECWAILERHPDAFETWVAHHGIPPIGAGLTLSHLLHFQLHERDVHAATASYLEVMDLVNLRLTGRAAATQCTMFAAQVCDNRSVGTTDYDAELVEMARLDADRLPPLIPVDGIVGEVLPDVASDLGLPTGVTVRAGMNDTQAGAFATGALAQPDRRGLMVGTTAVLIQSMPTMGVDLDHEILSMPAPVPGRYVVMAENGIAGRAVERALAVLSPGATTSDEQFAELETALDRSPTGAGGLLFLPWLAGSMSPSASSEMRGGYLGMTLQTERADLLRATVEGVARNLRWLSPAVTELCGAAATEVMFAGGAARSHGVARVLADVLGLPVVVPERPEVTAARAVGAVALARTTGSDPCATGAPPQHRVEPDADAAAVHDRLQPIFEAAFSANAPICQALGS
jgi:xylulokinase